MVDCADMSPFTVLIRLNLAFIFIKVLKVVIAHVAPLVATLITVILPTSDFKVLGRVTVATIKVFAFAFYGLTRFSLDGCRYRFADARIRCQVTVYACKQLLVHLFY